MRGLAAVVVVLQLLACGDRSPPALWPEPPPPTLATPLGIASPNASGDAASEGDDVPALPVDEAGVEAAPSDTAPGSPEPTSAPIDAARPAPSAEVAPSVTPTQRPRTATTAGR